MPTATNASRWLLNHVNASALFIGIVAITMALSIGGVASARRRWPHFAEGTNNSVGSVLMAMVGTVYAVVVGFVVVTLWTTSAGPRRPPARRPAPACRASSGRRSRRGDRRPLRLRALQPERPVQPGRGRGVGSTFDDLGVTVVGPATYVTGQRDLTEVTAAIKEAEPDLLAVATLRGRSTRATRSAWRSWPSGGSASSASPTSSPPRPTRACRCCGRPSASAGRPGRASSSA